MSKSNEKFVVLAALYGGEHVQVGKPVSETEAHDLFDRLDAEQSGFRRVNGRLRHLPATQRDHFIGGERVSFYRVRQVPNEFGTVRTFRRRDVRLSTRSRKEHSIISKTTPSGIQRPRTGGFARWDYARSVAKRANVSGVGRGHRAIKAQDGNYTVIFRPAVTTNKQRKVREVI